MADDSSNSKIPTGIDTDTNPNILSVVKVTRRNILRGIAIGVASLSSACSSSPEQVRTQETLSFKLSNLTESSSPEAIARGDEYKKLLEDFKILGVSPDKNGYVSFTKEVLEKKGVRFSYVEVNPNDGRQGNVHVENLVITINNKKRYIGKGAVSSKITTIPAVATR